MLNILHHIVHNVQVNCYELQYGPQQQISNIIPQSQIKHDAPVLCSDINSNVSD
jgi:hypothetical protein